MLSSIVAEIGSKHKNGIFDSMQTIHIGQSYKASTSIITTLESYLLNCLFWRIQTCKLQS